MIDPANATKDELLALLKTRENDSLMLDWLEDQIGPGHIGMIVYLGNKVHGGMTIRYAIAAAMEAR